MSKPECGRVDCSTCPYPDCDKKYWTKKNPATVENRKKYAKEYYQKNKKTCDEYHTQWLKQNKEHVRKYNTEYVRAWRARKKADNDSTGA